MSTDRIKDLARALRLPFIAANIDDELEKATTLSQPLTETIENLFELELFAKSDKAAATRIKKADFPYRRTLTQYDPARMPQEARKHLEALKTLEFIAKGQNVVAYGNPGTGKTCLAIALGISAAEAGYSVRFFAVPSLINRLKEAKARLMTAKLEKTFRSTDLIILDELGYISTDREGAELLYQHISMRCECKSTVVTTNLAFDKWQTIFGDPIVTAAIADRLTNDSYVLNMVGESNRKPPR